MNKSFKTLFFLKKGSRFKGGAMPIYVRVTVEGKRAELSIQRTCESNKWNQSVGRAIGKRPEIVQLNNYLDSLQGKIYDIQRGTGIKNQIITADFVKQKFLGCCT